MYNLKKNCQFNMSYVRVIDKMEQNSHTGKHPNHINISQAYEICFDIFLNNLFKHFLLSWPNVCSISCTKIIQCELK